MTHAASRARLPRAALLAAAAVAAAVLASCVTITDDDRFLLAALGGPAKANALVEEGIAQYTVRLVQRAEYEAVQDVRAYFDAALRYDPANARAKQYRELVDTYLVTRLKANLKEADRLLAKKPRTRDEDWAMVAAVQKAVRLDAASADAQRLAGATAELRDALVKEGVAAADAAAAKATATTAEDARDRLWVDAYLAARRVQTIESGNSAARDGEGRARKEIDAAFARRLAAVRKLLDGLKFTLAKGEIAKMSELSRRSGGPGDEAVRTATYELNYRWARWLYDQKDYASADVRVKAALAVRRSADATALAKRIADAQAATSTGSSFETALKDLDRLVAAGELEAAQARLDSLENSTADGAKLAQLDARRERIRAFLPDLYARGLAAYREEDFAAAIELLATVVAIDVGYEQAADYLEKARSKQRLLEQY